MSQETKDYSADDKDFRKIATQRFMYQADKCKETPLVGYLINMMDMPPIMRKNDAGELVPRPWQAFLLKITRPVLASDRDKVVSMREVGSEVLIPATFELAQFITKAANAPGMVFELRIQPSKKIDIGHGQQLWLYELAAKPEPLPRRRFGIAAILAPRQLPPPGGTSDEDGMPALPGGGGDDDIPF